MLSCNVHGPYALKGGKLRTGDARLAQDCKRAKESGGALTVHLLAADPVAEFTGTVEDVGLVSNKLPATWEVVMMELSAKLRR